MLLLAGGLAGCGGGVRLAHTPKLHVIDGPAAFERVPESKRQRDPKVIFVTDRKPETSLEIGPAYGMDRSFDTQFGLATVHLGEGTWDELVAASTRDKIVKIPMSIGAVEHVGTFRLGPQSFDVMPDGSLGLSELGRQQRDEDAVVFHRLLGDQLAEADSGDVYIIVHGFSVKFDGSLYTTTHIWHHMGRPGVAISYSWPAGRSGLLRGYNYDRESSEFTVPHLKQLIKSVAAHPDVERIHIVGHSRGTQVVADAVRELHLSSQASGQESRHQYKLHTVVLAAPDMDWTVFRHRFIGDNATNASERLVIYVSPYDEAIGMADWLFGSARRLGRLVGGDMTRDATNLLGETERVQFVQCDVSGFGTTHNYIYSHPSVLSDLILVLREHRLAGENHGRPLDRDPSGFWIITNSYPDPARLRRTEVDSSPRPAHGQAVTPTP